MSNLEEKKWPPFPQPTNGPLYILAPFVPTPQDVVDRMLQLAEVTSDDVIHDLGCGDGRIVITAAKKYGARGFGVDIEPYWVAESESNARAAGVEHLVTFKLQDALTVDTSPATVVMLYLVHWSTLKLRTMLTKDMKPGTRIVSHSFDMGDWPPVKMEAFIDEGGNARTIYLWIVAAATAEIGIVSSSTGLLPSGCLLSWRVHKRGFRAEAVRPWGHRLRVNS